MFTPEMLQGAATLSYEIFVVKRRLSAILRMRRFQSSVAWRQASLCPPRCAGSYLRSLAVNADSRIRKVLVITLSLNLRKCRMYVLWVSD